MHIRAGYNQVLIKPLQDNSVIKMGGGEIFIDSSFQKEKHTVTCGEIVSIPEQIDDSLRTEIVVKVGDMAFFHYLSTFNAIREERYYTDNGQVYYAVNYESLYCVKRGEEVICLNGYTLVRPIKKHGADTIGAVYIPEARMKEEVASRGVVAYAGTPLKGQKQLCNIGDEIVFRKSSSVKIQAPFHDSFGEELYRMKNGSILAIITTQN